MLWSQTEALFFWHGLGPRLTLGLDEEGEDTEEMVPKLEELLGLLY